MNTADDLYLGSFLVSQGILPKKTSSANPTVQNGVGPMGRIAFLDIVPLTLGTTNVATAQANTSGTPLALTAGTGVTSGPAPDGTGSTVLFFDVARCPSLTSASNLSAITYTIVGWDFYGNKTTQTLAGPNANTVTGLKALAAVLSITPNATNASTVSAGTSDVFGLPFAMVDAGAVVSAKWNNTLAQDAGTFTVADATIPATAATGDPRGTYKPSANASNGTRRLVVGMYLMGSQCGSAAIPYSTSAATGAMGVFPF